MQPWFEKLILKFHPFTSVDRFVRREPPAFFERIADRDFHDGNTVEILARCGLGDLLSFLARLGSVKERHPGRRIRFWLGGFARIPERMRDLAFRDPRVDEVVLLRGYSGASARRARLVSRFVARRVGEDAVVLDWLDLLSCLSYPMEIPHRLTLLPAERKAAAAFLEERKIEGCRAVVVQCATRHGNTNPEEAERFWPEENYRRLAQRLADCGRPVVLVGLEGDNRGLGADAKMVFSAEGWPLSQTCALIEACGGFVGTNSFTWEVAYRAGKPTLCFYLNTPHWLSVHAPEEARARAPWLHVETRRGMTPEQAFERFQELERKTPGSGGGTQEAFNPA